MWCLNQLFQTSRSAKKFRYGQLMSTIELSWFLQTMGQILQCYVCIPYWKIAQKGNVNPAHYKDVEKKNIRKYLINKSHLRFFPLLCRSSSSRKDKLFHNHQSKQSLVSCGFVSHVFIPPRTTSCASPPTPL